MVLLKSFDIRNVKEYIVKNKDYIQRCINTVSVVMKIIIEYVILNLFL